MQSTLHADEIEAKRLEEEEQVKRKQDEEMLAQGSTAAAKAFAQRSSVGVGDPIFAGNYRMKLQEEEARNRQKQDQLAKDQRNSIGMGSHISSPTSPRATGNQPGMIMPPYNPNASRGTSPPSTSSEAFPSNAPNGVLAEAAQRVLEAARRSAKGDVSQPSGSQVGKEPSASVTSHTTSNYKTSTDASSSLRPSAASPSPPIGGSESRSHSLSPSPAPSIKGGSKRKSFLGGFRKSSTNFEEDLKNSAKKGKGKNSDGESVKSGGGKSEKKGSRSRTPSESAKSAALPTTQENADDFGGTTTPGGTLGRRKYRDTRELHLVASELAAQALVGNEYPYASFAAAAGQNQQLQNGTQSPAGTRTPSEGLTVGNRKGNNAYSWGGPEVAPYAVGMNMPNGSVSQTNLISSPSHSGFLTPMTSNPNAGSAPTSPRFGNAELSPGGSPNPGMRSRQGSTGYAIHATQTQQAKLNGLPQDMLTGLGDGPYPTLARRLEAAGLDMLDPFGIPTTHDRDSPFAASVRASNNGGSPGTSISSHHQQQSSGTSTPGGTRRPMMQMSMSAPANELDYGLTKLGKGKQSRNASRNVTPQQSREKLRDRAKKDAEKDGTGLVNGGTIGNGSRKGSATPAMNGHPPSSAGAAVNASSGTLGLSKSNSPPSQRTPSSPPPTKLPSSGSTLGSPALIPIPRSPRAVSPNPNQNAVSPPSSPNPSSLRTAMSNSSSNLKQSLSKDSDSLSSNAEKDKKKGDGGLRPNGNGSSADTNGLLGTSVSSKGGRFSFFGKKRDGESKSPSATSPAPSAAAVERPKVEAASAAGAAMVSNMNKPPQPQSQAQPQALPQNRAHPQSESQAPAQSQAQPPQSQGPPQNKAQPHSYPQPAAPAPSQGTAAMSTRPSESSVVSTNESDDSFRLPYLANSPEKSRPPNLNNAAPTSSLGSQRQVVPQHQAPAQAQAPLQSQYHASSPQGISRSRSREAVIPPQSAQRPQQGQQGNSNLNLPNGNGNANRTSMASMNSGPALSANGDPRGRRGSNVSAHQAPNGALSPSSPPRPDRSSERARGDSRSPARRPNGMVGPSGTPLQPQQQGQERSRVPSNAGGSFKGMPHSPSSTSLSSNNKGSSTPRIPNSPSAASFSQKSGQNQKNGTAPAPTNSKLNPKNQQESKEKSSGGGRFSKFVRSFTGSNDKAARNERSGTPSSITSAKSSKSQSQASKAQTVRGRQASAPATTNPTQSQSLNSRPVGLGRPQSNSPAQPQNIQASASSPRNVSSRINPFQLASSKSAPKANPAPAESTSSPNGSGKSTPSFATAASAANSPEISRKNLSTTEEMERQRRLTDALGLGSDLVSVCGNGDLLSWNFDANPCSSTDFFAILSHLSSGYFFRTVKQTMIRLQGSALVEATRI